MFENWLKDLDEHNVQYVVLDQSQDENLVGILRSQPEWSVDFDEDGAVIFSREREETGNE